MKRVIKIGSRESNLALWQARYIEDLIQAQGLTTELILIKSEGDIDLVSPLYEMGVEGIFTRSLDLALLSGDIDLAVHSYKDVPTRLAEGLIVAAVPERGSWKDMLVFKDPDFNPEEELDVTIATSSLRRSAQWLNRYPTHTIESLRGNLNTRLQKLNDQPAWRGALFAAAGIERINLQVPFKKELDWMLPAPAQGALVVVTRENDTEIRTVCAPLDHSKTNWCTSIERDFLRALMGGCSLPISGLAEWHSDLIHFRGNILSPDGKQKAEIESEISPGNLQGAGKAMAERILHNGGEIILRELKRLVN